MTIDSRRQLLKVIKQRKYLNKDFDGFKADLFEYARVHYPDRIKDFSEASLGGLLLELAAYVGDVQSFYLDHQFHELSAETATESRNIEKLVRDAGVPIVGASPAVCNITFIVEVPVSPGSNPPVPDPNALPIIYASTFCTAQNGIQFELTEDIDYTDTDRDGNLIAVQQISKRDANNNVSAFFLSRTEVCISGFRGTENFSVGSFAAFLRFTLSKENVTDIIAVNDSLGNKYYQVEYLTQDTVFQTMLNRNEDNELVKENMMLIPAPYRFISETAIDTRLNTLTFGGGSAQSLTDDIIPDPSDFALPLYGKRTFSRFTLNPGNLLQTTTLGVVAPNSTISVTYRYGGGLSHNVGAGSIRGVQNIIIGFPNSPTPTIAAAVRASVDAVNLTDASGGDDAPTLSELKLRVPAARAAQSRIVTKEDLIARVYTMPSNFGRVFRASIRSNPNNPLASLLYIISRNGTGRLTISPDSLKKNLATYLNQYRMISDAIDILDAQVVNIQIQFIIVIDPTFNRNLVLQNVIARLKQYFDIKHFEIDQPIVIDDIRNIIYNNQGVISLQSMSVSNVTTTPATGTRAYSNVQFDVQSNTTKGIIIGPPGSIFELRYKDNDIIGSAI